MTNITNSRNINFMQNNKPKSFQVKILDLSIAEIQYYLTQRLEREVPENGDFAPIFETYLCKNPKTDLGELKVRCDFVKTDDPKQSVRILKAIKSKKNSKNEESLELIRGSKKEILDYLKNTDFFEDVKAFAKAQ